MNASRYFTLGLFVLIGVGILVGGVIVLGAGSLFQDTIEAETYVDESVSGLQVGSAVKYRGVTVGKVSDIGFAASMYAKNLDPDNAALRKIVIRMSLDTKVVPEADRNVLSRMTDNGLRAQLVKSGITGSAYVGLNFFDPRESPQEKVPWQPRRVHISSVPSRMTQVVSALERLNSALQDADLPGVVKRMNTFLNNADQTLNDLEVPKLRKQVTGFLEQVNQTNQRVQKLASKKELDQAISKLPKLVTTADHTISQIQKLVADDRVQTILSSMSDASNQAGPAIKNVKQLTAQTRQLLTNQQDNVRRIIRNFRQASSGLDALIDEVRRNPARVLFGKPPKRKHPGK